MTDGQRENRQSGITIGKGPAPPWCAGLLMPYMRMDGRVGYEFHGADRDFELCCGDQLIRKGGRIEIKRRRVR